MIYFDFGAHRGIKAAEYAAQVRIAEAFLYEPNPAIKVWEIPGVKTNIFRFAAWDRNGVEPLYLGKIDDATGSSLIWAKTSGELDKEHPIEVKTFDAAQMLLDARHWIFEPIEIKMNIEGAEYRVFDRMEILRVLENTDQIKALHISFHAEKLGPEYVRAYIDDGVIRYIRENGFSEFDSPFGAGFTTWRR